MTSGNGDTGTTVGDENAAAVAGTKRTRLDFQTLPNEPVADAFGSDTAGPELWRSKGWANAASDAMLTGMKGGSIVSKVRLSGDIGNAEIIGYTGTIDLWTNRGWTKQDTAGTDQTPTG